jgi:transformation/transcription domain-associated protein
VEVPMNYLSLLRVLFRSIGGGKFEQLYKEFLPLLPDLLRGLMSMQKRGPDNIKEICIELCLTVPARLSSLLPFIPLLMTAVLLALQARDEQVIKLGLRTLEFWVDNLNPEYLYPHMCEVLSELMRSLCALLRPHPSPFGQTALNVLGKLGGRNRRFQIEAFELDIQDGPEEGLSLALSFLPNCPFTLPMDRCVKIGRSILTQPESSYNGDKQVHAKR